MLDFTERLVVKGNRKKGKKNSTLVETSHKRTEKHKRGRGERGKRGCSRYPKLNQECTKF